VIAHVILMRATDARGRHEAAAFFAGRGIVLDDEVLEIGDPHGTVGADFGMHGEFHSSLLA
jgi:hypothetical protein